MHVKYESAQSSPICIVWQLGEGVSSEFFNVTWSWFKITSCELQGVKMEVNKEKIRSFLQFFFDRGEKASQVAEIANGVYGADTVTSNYVQFWFRRLGSVIIDV
ncbi:hypothetical protein TNCV_1033881 [Trichonephila clavipes]|nr:hypothetical protein TNCV_1033881 [Trichonephila clavipes]